jgi:HPt (histidine-containing phosphotransfer) domain-containing protein
LIDCLGRYLKGPIPVRTEVDMTPCANSPAATLEFERELVETFVSSGDQCLAEILAALRSATMETIGKRAHALKGASANIHASGLAAAASSLENAARKLGAVKSMDWCGADQETAGRQRPIAQVRLRLTEAALDPARIQPLSRRQAAFGPLDLMPHGAIPARLLAAIQALIRTALIRHPPSAKYPAH